MKIFKKKLTVLLISSITISACNGDLSQEELDRLAAAGVDISQFTPSENSSAEPTQPASTPNTTSTITPNTTPINNTGMASPQDTQNTQEVDTDPTMPSSTPINIPTPIVTQTPQPEPEMAPAPAVETSPPNEASPSTPEQNNNDNVENITDNEPNQEEEEPTDTETFTLVSSSPSQSDINRSLVDNLILTLPKPAFETTVNTNTIMLLANDQTVPISVNYQQGDTVITVTPNQTLSPFTQYTLSLNSEIMAQDGDTLSQTSITFTTAGNIGSTTQTVIDSCMNADQLEMLHLTNDVRAQARNCNRDGRLTFHPAALPLAFNCKLGQAATTHTQDMAFNIQALSHTGSDGSSFGQRYNNAGYRFSSAAENIAFRTDDSAPEIIRQWRESTTGHCQNMMNTTFTEIGIAKASNRSGRLLRRYWTQNFALPR